MISPPANAQQDSKTCPRCSSIQVVRNGHRNGHQRFLCRGCNRSFGHTTVPGSNGVRLVEKHAAFLALCSTPVPLRVAAQQVGVALSTVFRWRHAYLQRLEQEEQFRHRNFSGAVAALFSNVCINERWCLARRQSPEIARFPAISGLDTLAGTVTHLVQCQHGHVVDQACAYSHRRATRSDFVQIISKYVVPGTILVSPFGNGIVEKCSDRRGTGPTSEDGSTTVTWLLAARARNLPSDHMTVDDISQARKLATRLRLVFRRWMRAFRGIAVYYVQRYTAWFNSCWQRAQEKHIPQLYQG